MAALRRLFLRLIAPLLAGLFAAGCASAFSAREAHEVSRDRLLAISDSGSIDHLRYMGSDANYHYVFDTRPGKERSYKVRADSIKLKDTFGLGEDSYVLLPWVIEGQPFGSRVEPE